MNNYPNILKEASKDYLVINRSKKRTDVIIYQYIFAYKVKDLIHNYRIDPYKTHRYFFNHSLLYQMSKTFIFLNRIFCKN